MAFKSSREPRNSRHAGKASKWVQQYIDVSSASDISMSDSDQDDVRSNGKSNKALSKTYRNGRKWTVELGSDEDEAQDFEDTPLLLIGFEKFRKKKVNLKLHTDVLNRVLKNLVDDLPLSIINIIGSAGLGKSFTLNYVIKKLEAIQNQEKNWMGWDSAHNSFDGFPVGKKETNGTSTGIYIWPQPFVMNTEHGRVAVLVTETNGLHDDTFDTQEALTSILCLSLLTSSVVIYNTCESQLTEDSFLPLIPYIRFGKKIHESFAPNYEPPFQVLSFLIRDWDDQTEYCCGASDGKKFLQDKLRSNLDDATAKYIAKCMKEYFSSVDCFLLPPAGDAITSEDFNGCPDRLDSEFAKKLEKYINALVSTTHLPAKQVYKMKINSGNFKQFLDAYIQLFNSYNKGIERLTGTALHDVSTAILAECTLEKAMLEYCNAWKNVQNETRYMEVRNMHTFHATAKQQAQLHLKSTMIHMWYSDMEDLIKKLSSRINEEYKSLKEKNDKLRLEYITECFTEFLDSYKIRLQTKVHFADDVSFHEVDYIIAASTEAVNEGMRQFKESFSQEGEEGRAEIRRKLNEKTSSIVNNLLERNTLNQQRAERQIMKHMEDSIENYKTFMQQLTTGITIDGLALGNMHNHLRKKAVDNFNASVFPGTRAFQQKFLCDLETSIDTLFKTFLTGEQTKMEEQQLESNTLLKTVRREYEKEFSEFAEMSMSRNEMEDLHTQISSNILDKFKAKNPYPQGGANYLNFKTALLQELDSAKQNFMLNHVEKKRKIESYQKAQEQSINNYITEMDQTMRGGCMPEAELNKLHEDVHSRALNTFDEMTENSSDAIQQRTELENRITEMFSNLKISNNQSLQVKTATAETILNDAQQQYINVMENGIYKSQKQFEGAHQQYLENYEKMLTETLKGDDELKQSLLNKFGNFVSQKYNALVGNIEVKIKQERLTLFKLLQDVQTMYHDEMKKQSKGRTFSSINALEQLHRKISINAITQCSRLSKITPTPEQKQRLILAMEDSFCKYKLEYTINKSNQTDNPAIGIDLGTTYCCVAIWQDKKIKVIPSHVGDETTPSYVAFQEDGVHVIGQTAKDEAFRNPESTIFDAKRMIGRRMGDPILQNDIKYWPFTVIEHNGVPQIDVRGKPHPPERVSATLLASLKAEAEKYLGGIKVTKAVITVPAYFDDGQRAATVDAGEMAGLEVLTILNEPTAAAIAYKMEQFSDTPRKVLVYDLGGGTFDVAVLQTGAKTIDVLGVDGDTHLGGEDFDKNVMEECVKQFREKTGINLLQDKDSQVKPKKEQCRRILRRLQTYSEKAKRHLSSALQISIVVDQIVPEKDLHVVITRAKFEELNQVLFKKTIDVVDKALKDAKVSKDKIDDILLVGGSTRIPKIREMLSQHFNGKALSHSVHPDIAVAYGAAVQAALLSGAKGESLFDFESIRDVTPMALGVEAKIGHVSGRFSIIIPKNTKIPHKAVEKYYTSYNNQPSAEINVYQGENPVAKKNNFLGTFDLDGIPPNRAGAESLDVTMEIDKMGILHVTAVCDSTNIANSITVQAKKGRLTEEEKKEIKTAIQAQAKKREKLDPSNIGDPTASSNDDWFRNTTGSGKASFSGSNFDLSSDEQDF